jgi:predicted RNA polymerase sigma factor
MSRQLSSAKIHAISEEHRAVITLREIDGLSYQEIASAMSIPIGTVRSRVFRARDLIDHKLRRVHDGGLGRRAPVPHAHGCRLARTVSSIATRG